MTSFMVPAGGTAAVLAGVLVAGSGRGLSSALALTIVSVVGYILACLLILIPIWSFVWPMWRDKTVGDSTPYSHVLMVASGAAWGIYAFLTWDKSRVGTIINATSFGFQVVYVLVFIWYATGTTRWTAVALLLITVIASIGWAKAVVVKVIQTGEWDKKVVAAVASTVAFVSYGAVGLDIEAVARSKNVSKMDPLAEVLFNLLNAGASVYYAYMSKPVDNFIGVPNGLGLLLLLVQLVLYVKHCRAKPEDEEEAAPAEENNQPAAALEVGTSQNVINTEPAAPAATNSPDYGDDLLALFADSDSESEHEIEVVIEV